MGITMTSINPARLCREGGREYAATYIGLPVIYTTWDGQQMLGEVTEFTEAEGMPYPVARFDGGMWARLGHQFQTVTR